MTDDLVFTGKRGKTPDEDSVEYLILRACCSESVWPDVLVLKPEDFERAIDRLKQMGWGFEWRVVH